MWTISSLRDPRRRAAGPASAGSRTPAGPENLIPEVDGGRPWAAPPLLCIDYCKLSILKIRIIVNVNDKNYI